MNYRELKAKIESLTEEQLEEPVVYFDDNNGTYNSVIDLKLIGIDWPQPNGATISHFMVIEQ